MPHFLRGSLSVTGRSNLDYCADSDEAYDNLLLILASSLCPSAGELDWSGSSRVLWWWTTGEFLWNGTSDTRDAFQNLFPLLSILFIDVYFKVWMMPELYHTFRHRMLFSFCAGSHVLRYLYVTGQEFHLTRWTSCWYCFCATLWCKLISLSPTNSQFAVSTVFNQQQTDESSKNG
jgi:hypothetical protein